MMRAKAHAAPARQAGAAVVATRFAALALLVCSAALQSAVLPEDRADVLFHSFSGGGADISGPSILVRKKFNENISATVNHYVDNVSSASIDVITTASPYSEQRKENSLSVDYLNDTTLMSMGYTKSVENDFDAATLSLGISQDMFGDLTTLSVGYSKGDNIVGKNGADFEKDQDLRSYRLSLTQIMTKDLIMALAFETITDQGYLNNPYRTVRYLDDSSPRGFSYQTEIYPNTRTSNAVALRGRYYLQHRAALHGSYRFFSDTWGIQANTWEVGYTQPYKEDWMFELSYRFYDQTQADFYSDLFDYKDAFTFMARDKEMSSFTTRTIGLGATWEFKRNGTGWIKRGSLNLNIDYILFDYDNFRDLTVNTTVGTEPLYNYDATVLRAFVSIWF
jgi:hypothetical protein